jgi:hypothetical protein
MMSGHIVAEEEFKGNSEDNPDRTDRKSHTCGLQPPGKADDPIIKNEKDNSAKAGYLMGGKLGYAPAVDKFPDGPVADGDKNHRNRRQGYIRQSFYLYYSLPNFLFLFFEK